MKLIAAADKNWTIVCDVDGYMVVLLCVDTDCSICFSFQCLHRVFQEIKQYLGELVFISVHVDGFGLAGECEGDMVFFTVTGQQFLEILQGGGK